MRAAASSLIVSAVLSAGAACGTDDGSDQPKPETPAPDGRQLFVQRCGSCHTLADAGTTGRVGPNLDEHFGPHHPPHTGKVLDVIREGPGRMPANRVEGREARAVARYVVRATRP